MMAHMPTPQRQVVTLRTLAATSPETQVLMTNGSGRRKVTKTRLRRLLKSATMISEGKQGRASHQPPVEQNRGQGRSNVSPRSMMMHEKPNW